MLIAMLLLAAPDLHFETGRSLYLKCMSRNIRDQSVCYGFMTAAHDAIVSSRSSDAKIKDCFSVDLNQKSIANMFAEYLRGRPSQQDLPAFDLINSAIRNNYPLYPCDDGDPD